MTKGLRMPIRAGIRGAIFILFFLLGLATAHSGIVEVRAIEVGGEVGERVITLEFTEAVHYRSFTLKNPPQLVLDIPGAILKEPRTIEVRNEVVETISYRQHGLDTLRLVVNLAQPAQSQVRKVGNKLLLSLFLPREAKARLLAEERAKVRAEREEKERLTAQEKEEEERRRAEQKAEQLLEQGVKREIELKVREREGKLATHLSQGERHYRANRFDEAIREFEAVLALEPGNEEARNYLSMAQEGKRTQLLAKEGAAREAAERQEEERRGRGERHREEEREAGIAEHLRRAREYHHQGRYAEAIFQAERVLALSPGNRPAEELIEESIIRSRKQALEIAERRAQVEKEIVERQRILDVTRAPFASPVDYIGVEPGNRDREKVRADLLEEDVREAEGLRRMAEEVLVTLDFRDADIADVLLHLASLSKITIAIDERALGELEDRRVTIFTPAEIPLTDALDIVLKVKGLDYVFKEHYIWVAQAGRGEEAVTRVHRLRHGIRTIRPVALELERDDDEN